MNRHLYTILVAVLLAVPALAGDGYSFNIQVTDGRTGLHANPDFATMDITPEQLERAAGDRVVVFDKTTGPHWRWMMLSWFDNDRTVEQRINDRGVARTVESADFGISAGRNGHFRLRCMRDECAVTVTGADEKPGTLTLKRDDLSPDLPLPARVSLTFR